jgi:hypothetical protein
MSEMTRDALTQKADAAFRQAATKVVELARQTGTPVIVWENGRTVKKSADEAAMELTKASTPVTAREEGRGAERAVKPAGKEQRKTQKTRKENH